MATNPDPKALAALCKQWGFEDSHTAGVCRFLKSPTGIEVMIKKDVPRARDSDVAACAKAVHLGVEEFLAGPQSGKVKKGLAGKPRQQIVDFLARQPGMCVEDESGRATSILAEGCGGSATGVPALVNAMARDGQLKLNRSSKRTYKIELVKDGPRVADMMPLDLQTAKNAHLPTVEVKPGIEPPPVEEQQPQFIDLSPYSPDDIAAALMERVILTIREGSAAAFNVALKEVEVRLDQAVTYGEKQARLRREAEEKLLASQDKVRTLESKIRSMERERRQVPKETLDVLVNGTPRPTRPR